MKKMKKIIQKIMNIILSTYTLIYVSPKNIIFLEIFFKNIFPNFSQFSETMTVTAKILDPKLFKKM